MNKVIDFKSLKRRNGKIYIANKDNYFYIDADYYFLCTIYTDNVPEGVKLMDELSPSFELFLMKKSLLDKKQFFARYEEFATAYRKEINSRKDYQRALGEIESLIKDGKKIVLLDDCNLKEYCHLNILGQELMKKRYKVGFINGSHVNFSL